jgi:RNA polymerase sigma-70 factor (ECF subfamily)
VGSDAAEAVRLTEEERLIAEAQAGNVDALRPLLLRYAEPLFAGVILPRLGSAAAAEDVLRDTFVTAIEKIRGFRWEGRGIYGWLRQIAVNKVVDVHRRSQRTGRALGRLADEPAPPAAGADESLIAEEERRRCRVRIDAAMDRLTPRYAEAIRLRLVEERSRAECAERLGVSVGTFDVLLFRSIRAFRKQFEEMGG